MGPRFRELTVIRRRQEDLWSPVECVQAVNISAITHIQKCDSEDRYVISFIGDKNPSLEIPGETYRQIIGELA